MAFGRRRKQQSRDPFDHLSDDRRQAESDTPWFLAPDEGPDLDIQAGISSNLDEDDLAASQGSDAGSSDADSDAD